MGRGGDNITCSVKMFQGTYVSVHGVGVCCMYSKEDIIKIFGLEIDMTTQP
jgi:tetrahydromethanopterin S-methyltransferase subunit D